LLDSLVLEIGFIFLATNMPTTTPSSFSFNFLSEAVTAQDQSHEDTGEREPEEYLCESGGESTNSTESKIQQRIPFGWLDQDNLQALLVERAQEELVCTELQVAPAVEPSLLPESTTVETCHNRASSGAVIRCVDLSQSSYLRPSTTTTTTDAEVWKTTDIEPGLYEGGRKVWECSLDLVRYLAEHNISLHRTLGTTATTTDQEAQLGGDDDETTTARTTVTRTMFALELGCGHGLPGCYLLRQALLQDRPSKSAAVEEEGSNQGDVDFTMVFTDYNESVVLDATLSNIVLNCCDVVTTAAGTIGAMDDIVPHILLGAGDWLDMSRQLRALQPDDQDQDNDTKLLLLPRDGKFALILAAETLYSLDAARETAQLLAWHLEPETGVAYIATKRYYFGVNGGVDSFRSAAAAVAAMATTGSSSTTSHVLNVECVKVMDSGAGNIREILRVRCVAKVE
jgi:hypothetical protein